MGSELKKKLLFIGIKLRQARIEKGMSQTELGQEIGVSHTSVGFYERGDYKIPIDKLLSASRVLSKPIGYFFGQDADYEEKLYEKFMNLAVKDQEEKYGEMGIEELLKTRNLNLKTRRKIKAALQKVLKNQKKLFNKIW